jgi:hypothetical protein
MTRTARNLILLGILALLSCATPAPAQTVDALHADPRAMAFTKSELQVHSDIPWPGDTTAQAPSLTKPLGLTFTHYPTRSDWSIESTSNGPSLKAGGGLDIVITRPFAWRLINMEYTHSWMPSVDARSWLPTMYAIRPQNGFIISTAAVVRIGTW